MRSDEVFGPCSSNDPAEARGMVCVCVCVFVCERGKSGGREQNLKFSDDQTFADMHTQVGVCV